MIVKIRLISSGIFLLNERRPASTCITGTCSLTAASAPDNVDLYHHKRLQTVFFPEFAAYETQDLCCHTTMGFAINL